MYRSYKLEILNITTQAIRSRSQFKTVQQDTIASNYPNNKHIVKSIFILQCLSKANLWLSFCAALVFVSHKKAHLHGSVDVRLGRPSSGKRSCKWGIWKVFLQNATWCVVTSCPFGWRKLHTDYIGKASHLTTNQNTGVKTTMSFLVLGANCSLGSRHLYGFACAPSAR